MQGHRNCSCGSPAQEAATLAFPHWDEQRQKSGERDEIQPKALRISHNRAENPTQGASQDPDAPERKTGAEVESCVLATAAHLRDPDGPVLVGGKEEAAIGP